MSRDAVAYRVRAFGSPCSRRRPASPCGDGFAWLDVPGGPDAAHGGVGVGVEDGGLARGLAVEDDL